MGRQDDGELGGEERKIFEEQLPDMWLWKVAIEGGSVRYLLCTLLPLCTHDMAFSRGYTWITLISLHSTGRLFPMQRRVH